MQAISGVERVSRALELSIIIVNWNSCSYLRRCLRSLFQHTQGVAFEVIVVDNSSYDGCQAMLALEFPDCIFVQCLQNIGFARANNLARRYAKAPLILFLNPDTELIEDSVSALLAEIRNHPDAGVIGCRLLNGDRSLQTSCVQALPTPLNQLLDSNILRNWLPNLRLWGTQALSRPNAGTQRVEAISGACMLTRADVFDAVGGFSEFYFMYGEDVDLCRKIESHGYSVVHTPKTSMIHYGGRSSSRGTGADVMMRQAVHQYFKSNCGSIAAISYRVAMAISASLRIALLSLGRLFRRFDEQRAASFCKWLGIFRWSFRIRPST